MNIVLNQQSDTPIYAQIYTQISSQIISGTLQPGLKLPGIRQIASELHISVIPVKMAWEKLDENNFIKTEAGCGTFVKDLPACEIESKLNEKARNIVLKTCKEAKDAGISKEILINLIKELY